MVQMGRYKILGLFDRDELRMADSKCDIEACKAWLQCLIGRLEKWQGCCMLISMDAA